MLISELNLTRNSLAVSPWFQCWCLDGYQAAACNLLGNSNGVILVIFMLNSSSKSHCGKENPFMRHLAYLHFMRWTAWIHIKVCPWPAARHIKLRTYYVQHECSGSFHLYKEMKVLIEKKHQKHMELIDPHTELSLWHQYKEPSVLKVIVSVKLVYIYSIILIQFLIFHYSSL